MSNFINPDDFQPLKRQIRSIKREKRYAPSQRQQYLKRTPPPHLVPNTYNDDLFYLGGHFVPVSVMRGSVLYLGFPEVEKPCN